MTASIGILAALQYRNKTGIGQMIDISLLDSAVSIMTIINQHYLVDGRIPQRRGNSYESGAPMESYRASDGDIVLAVGNDKMWKKLVELMEMPELLEKPEFATVHKRVQNRIACKEYIEQWSQQRTVDELVKIMIDTGIPAAPIYNIAQVCNDPHIAGARNMFTEFDHPVAGKVKVTNTAIRMSETDACVKCPPPVLGQHNDEVYKEVFGFSEAEVEDFRKAGII